MELAAGSDGPAVDSEGAPIPAVVSPGSADVVLYKAIADRLQFLQSTLQFHLQEAIKVIPGTDYLGTIRDLFDQARESAIEDLKENNQAQENDIQEHRLK